MALCCKNKHVVAISIYFVESGRFLILESAGKSKPTKHTVTCWCQCWSAADVSTLMCIIIFDGMDMKIRNCTPNVRWFRGYVYVDESTLVVHMLLQYFWNLRR